VTSDMTYLELLSKRLQSRRVASDVIEGRRKYLIHEDMWWFDPKRMTDPERERVIPAHQLSRGEQ